MRILRSCLIGVLIVFVIVIGFWQFHRHMVAAYARRSVAKVFHVSQTQVTIEQVQELGFWRYKLNPFSPQAWEVSFTMHSGSNPGTWGCSIDEPRFGHFGVPVMPGPDPMMPAK